MPEVLADEPLVVTLRPLEGSACKLNPDPDFNSCEAPQEFSDEEIAAAYASGAIN